MDRVGLGGDKTGTGLDLETQARLPPSPQWAINV